jgi:hypothetical protein
MKGRGGKGPGGLGLIVELDGEVGLAGERPAVTNFGAAAVGTCRETAAITVTSALLGSIPLARRWRKMWRCFSASQRGSGRLLAAAEDDGHGGELGLCELFHGRERGRAREGREKEEGVVSLLRVSRGTPWPSEAASRRWRRSLPGSSTHLLPAGGRG